VFDEAGIRTAVASIIRSIGEDPEREGLVDTPTRVAEMYAELFMGLGKDPREELAVGYELGHREMVIVRDIPFYSMCEHHLLPFYGTVHIGYIPDVSGRVVGISKLARVVEIVARRPQIQERMTTQIGWGGSSRPGRTPVHDYAWHREARKQCYYLSHQGSLSPQGGE